MRKEYDFSGGKRGPAIKSPGKTLITIMIDDDVIEGYRAKAEAAGRGYQTIMNEVLRTALAEDHSKRVCFHGDKISEGSSASE